MRIKLALMVLFVLLAFSTFLSPTHVLSESSNIKPAERVTLLNLRRTKSHSDFEKASVSFRPYTYNAVIGPNTDRDLVYGGLNFNGDRDWFKVALERDDQSRIKDLGQMDWSADISVPVLPIRPCPADGPCGRIKIPPRSSGKKIDDEDLNPHIAKPIIEHMYLVHTYDEERDLKYPARFHILLDFYTLVRVEELQPNESCTITWKRIPSPTR